MADAKISELTEGTSLGTGDMIPFVDVSDTSMAASGTTKYIDKENLLTAISAQEFVVRTEIETIENTTAGTFDFQNIPAGYDRLVIEGYVQGDVAATNDVMLIAFNNDTTDANYYRQYTSEGGTSVSTAEAADRRIGVVGGGNSVGESKITIKIEGYADSCLKSARCDTESYRTGGSDLAMSRSVVYHDSMTAAITRITLTTDNDPTDEFTGKLTLFAEKVQTVAPENPNVHTLTVLKPLTTITCDGTTVTQADFTGLDTTGVNRFVIKGRARGTEAVAETSMVVYLNNDTTDANYFNQAHTGNNGVTGAGESAAALGPDVPGASGSTDSYADIEIRFPNPGGSDIKGYESTYSSVYTLGSAGRTGHRVVRHDTLTSAITQITLGTDAGNLVGEFTLYAEVDANIGAVTYPGDAGTAGRFLQKVSTITDPSSGYFEWTDIPQYGYNLVLIGDITSAASATSDVVHIYFNGDETTTNYHRQHLAGDNGSTTGGESSDPVFIYSTAATSPTGSKSHVHAIIPRHSVDGALKYCHSSYDRITATLSQAAGRVLTYHDTLTSAITSIKIDTDAGGATNALTGTLTLYVERDIVMTPGKHEIETIENTTAGSFDFQNIPSGFKRLWIEGYVQGDVVDAFDEMHVAFNNDTTATNYYRQYTSEIGSSTTTTEAADRRLAIVGGGTAVGESKVSIVVEGYADSCLKSTRCESDSYRAVGTTLGLSRSVVYHDSMTDPITRITLTTDNDPTDQFTGKLTLYGEH